MGTLGPVLCCNQLISPQENVGYERVGVVWKLLILMYELGRGVAGFGLGVFFR